MFQQLPSERGTYVVVLRNCHAGGLVVGRIGRVPISAGYYLYVGSAFGPGGLRGRLSHHLRVSSKPRWHIDYLRLVTDPAMIWFDAGSSPREHDWVRVMERSQGMRIAVPRFGASDCRCESHLFFSQVAPSLSRFRNGLLAAGLEEGIREWRPASETGVSVA